MTASIIDAAGVYRTVSWTDAVDVLEATFSASSLPETPQRSVLKRGGAQVLLMPSWGSEAAGVKVVTVQPDNPQRGLPLIGGVYVLLSGDTLEPVAFIDAPALTAIRTAAVSAVATKHLAAPDAGRLVVFGAGVQAEAHVYALAAVRSLVDIAVVSRTGSSAEALVTRLVAAGFRARVGTPADAGGADLVCTCTTSAQPVLEGNLLSAGTHVNAVGAHTAAAREVDSATVVRAFSVVETRAVAAAEAGDLLIPLAEGTADPVRTPAAELTEVVHGRSPAPGEGDITLFKSVGVGFEDLALARFAYERIRTAEAQNE